MYATSRPLLNEVGKQYGTQAPLTYDCLFTFLFVCMFRFTRSRNKPLKPLTRLHITTGNRTGNRTGITTGGTGVAEHPQTQIVIHGLTGEPAGK